MTAKVWCKAFCEGMACLPWTRREYVRVGSTAASLPLTVHGRHTTPSQKAANRDGLRTRWVAMGRRVLLLRTVSDRDAAVEPPWMGLRRVRNSNTRRPIATPIVAATRRRHGA